MYAPETLVTSNVLLQIWHIDPKGDSGPPCHDKGNWKLHIRHWSIKPPVWWYSFKWKHLERCAYCGKRGSKELGRVDTSDGRRHYHSSCLGEQSQAYHRHDPNTCWNCKSKREAVNSPEG